MKTVIETPTFQKQAEKIWTEDERFAFIDWIADNPLAGDVIPGTDGSERFDGLLEVEENVVVSGLFITTGMLVVSLS